MAASTGGRTTIVHRPGSTHLTLLRMGRAPFSTSWRIESPVRDGPGSEGPDLVRCLRDAAEELLHGEHYGSRPDGPQRIAEDAAPYCAHLGPDALIVVPAFGSRSAKARPASGRTVPGVASDMMHGCGRAMRMTVSASRRGAWPQGLLRTLRLEIIEGRASTMVDPIDVMRRLAAHDEHNASWDGEPWMGPFFVLAPDRKGNTK